MTADADTLYMAKFMLTHGAFGAVILLLLVPKLTGHHRALHSTNAVIALWTIALGERFVVRPLETHCSLDQHSLRTGPLIKSCIRTVDCTEQTQFDPPIWTLDSMPDVECWPVRARARRKAQHADMHRVPCRTSRKCSSFCFYW